MTQPSPRAFVAMADAYPTEADARAEMPPGATDLPYRGIWLMPVAERTRVHLFTQLTPGLLHDSGWITEAEGAA